MLAICELLVAKRLTKKLILTRLPKGHTHEDIDAVFGKIWKFLAGLAILTPQAYRRALENASKQRNVKVNIYDIFCVPDYKQYMKTHIDKALAR